MSPVLPKNLKKSLSGDKIKGCQSNQIKKILGYSSKDEVIHKDDLVKV